MTAKILNFVLGYTKLGQFLDGYKSLIGSVLLAVVYFNDFLALVAPLFPKYELQISAAQAAIAQGLDGVKGALESLGYGFLTVGLARKYVKAKLPDAK
jgi:hypothetical protein